LEVKVLRVAHLHSQKIRGGAEVACNRISSALGRLSGIYSLVIPVNPLPTCFEKLFSAWRYRFENILFGWGFSETLTPTAYSPRLNEGQWDLVHLHSPYNSGLTIEEIGRISRRVPTIFTIHDARWILWSVAPPLGQDNGSSFSAWGKRATRDLGSRFLRFRLQMLVRKLWVVYPSTWLKDQATVAGLRNEKRSTVIPSPVGTAFFEVGCTKQRAKVSIGIRPDMPMILFVAWKAWKSRGDMNKGYDILEQAIPLLRSSHDFEFVILGHPGDSVPKHLNARLLSPDGSQEQVARIMRAADFVVGPSRQEALGLVVQEALATGTPALVSASTGYLDVVDDGITGYYFEPGSPEDFVRMASRMLEDRNELVNMGKRARERARDRWHPAHVAEQYFQFYLRAIQA